MLVTLLKTSSTIFFHPQIDVNCNSYITYSDSSSYDLSKSDSKYNELNKPYTKAYTKATIGQSGSKSPKNYFGNFQQKSGKI